MSSNTSRHKVTIISYFFYPENKPRAFRTYELARGLANKGYEVEVIIPTYYAANVPVSYHEIEAQYPLITIKTMPSVSKSIDQTKKSVAQKNSRLSKSVTAAVHRLIYFIFPSGRDFGFALKIIRYLRRNPSSASTVISISYPYSVHMGTIISRKLGYLKTGKVIVEFGDTLVGCPALPKSFVHKMIQRFISKNSDFLVTPTQSSIPHFTLYKSEDAVKVISQGYDFSDTRLKPYSVNDVPTFGYAGSFHAKVRNPKIFLDFLSTLEADFRFIVYSSIKDPELVQLFDHYSTLLGDKLVLKGLIPRIEVIEVMSAFDFLIFEENLSENQNPSKIVDYKLTKRPIFSFSEEKLDTDKFAAFMRGDYSKADFDEFNISDFSIDSVVDKYEALLNN